MKKFELAILFWFYKEPDICKNRLKLLKKYNPNLKIFGLYGGEVSEANEYQKQLGIYLDDFYTFSKITDKYWKWIHGDLMILDWYQERGRQLDWDSVVVVQWDMLVFDSFLKQFAGLEKNQIFLSGTRSIDEKLENSWNWIKYGGEERKNYLNFLEYIKKEYDYSDKPLASLFILEVFPKTFLDRYLTVENKEVGMLEYKVPIYSQIFNTLRYEKDIGVKWFTDQPKPLNARAKEIPSEYIENELRKEDGWRIFHPYFKVWDIE